LITTFAAACSSSDTTDSGTAAPPTEPTEPIEPIVPAPDPSTGDASVARLAPDDAGRDSGPVNTALLTLTIDGAPITPCKVALEKQKVFGMSGDGVLGEAPWPVPGHADHVFTNDVFEYRRCHSC